MTTTDAKEPENKNSDTWNFLGKTDPNYTKPITGKRFGGTAINPTYCYQKMTERFGPCGIGWKFEVTKRTVHEAPESQLMLFVDVALYISLGYKNGMPAEMAWSDAIPGVGGNMIFDKQAKGLFLDDEAYKKATTDALTNAMKFLGMSADIHTGLYDDSKYVASVKEEFGDSKVKNEPEKPPFNAVFNSPEEIAAWPAATAEQIQGFLKLATERRLEWMKAANEKLMAFVLPEDVVRWKTGNARPLQALGQKQQEAMSKKISERLAALQPQATATPPTDPYDDEIPF